MGMKLAYSTTNKARIDMKDYVLNILAEVDELSTDWSRNGVTPAAEHLFKINDNAPRLNKADSEHFHHVVAHLLFLCKRGRLISKKEWHL